MDIIDPRYAGGDYSEHNEDWHEGRAGWKSEQARIMLAKHRITPHSICDVGCGTGGVLDELAGLLPHRPETLVGYEVSPDAIARVPAQRRERVDVVHGTHDADDRTFDLMLALDVLEHVEDYYGSCAASGTRPPWRCFTCP